MMKNIYKWDMICLITVVVLYLINVYVVDTTNIFMNGYFNDLICPIGVLSFVNMVLNVFKVRYEKYGECMLFILLCGLFWEYSSFKDNAVADIWDIVCYEVGTILYCFVQKLCKSEK